MTTTMTADREKLFHLREYDEAFRKVFRASYTFAPKKLTRC